MAWHLDRGPVSQAACPAGAFARADDRPQETLDLLEAVTSND